MRVSVMPNKNVMKFLFLRGKVDERTEQVGSVDKSSDMWEHMACALTKPEDMCKILYWDGSRKVYYADNISVEYVHSLKHLNMNYRPDVIFARGGFKKYLPILREYPEAFKIYYGAGRRTVPCDRIDYNLILVDDERDWKKDPVKRLLWSKPVAPHFKPVDTFKQYDICYIANGQQSGIKRIGWVYKTKPRNLSMLHLGYKSKYSIPNNVEQVRLSRWDMPEYISKCRVGIAPYTSYDSGPRAVQEMLACGIDVWGMKDLRCYGAVKVKKEEFWECVQEAVKNNSVLQEAKPWSLEHAAEMIRGRL